MKVVNISGRPQQPSGAPACDSQFGVCESREGVSSNKRPFHLQLLHPGTLSSTAADSIAANYSIAITCMSNWITFSKACP